MTSGIRNSVFVAGAFGLCLGGLACGEEGAAPTDNTGMHIILPDPDLTLLAGTSATVQVNIVRNGFDGVLTLRAEGVPAGVLVPEVVVAQDDNEAAMSFSATDGATAGVSDMSIRAEGDTIEPSVRTLRLTIRPVGSFTLSAETLVLVPGGTASTLLTVNRLGGFTGTVALSVSAPPGIGASLQPTELTGNLSASVLSIVADRTLRGGSYSVRVTASSPGFADETLDVTVNILGT
jgi:hypothetical protein